MIFSREPYSEELVKEMVPLWEEHFDALAHFKDISLHPDTDTYERIDKAGNLRIYTARIGGILIGYNVFFVSKNLHHMTSLQAVQDLLWVDPECRVGMASIKFIKWCDEQLKREGVEIIMQHLKAESDHGTILRRMGYNLVDLVYERRVN